MRLKNLDDMIYSNLRSGIDELPAATFAKFNERCLQHQYAKPSVLFGSIRLDVGLDISERFLKRNAF